jgi:intein/homing endonuclease
VFGVMKGIRALRDAGIIAVACFVAGTPVATAVGLVPIENISVGDMVISADPVTGKITEKEVLEAYVRQSGELVHIWICGKETKATPDHPYHVVGRGWVVAGKLAAGDRLMALSGDAVA